jgi:glycosyltransferase involved in cell wall biosynthesis
MTITVLLPVYNGARTLDLAIGSILDQTIEDLELLIIDDCSTDGSAEVIRRWAAVDSRITPVIHERNLGLAGTLNEGLERARTELVARMDQDDEALPDRLIVQSDFMESNPEIVVCGSFVFHMGAAPSFDRLVELPVAADEIRSALVRANCMYHPSVVMRRLPILELGGYRGEFKNAEDYDLWLRVASRYQLANVPLPLLRYRFSADGMTLGRKWEQLYYVHLAQAAAEQPGLSLDHAAEVAQRSLATTSRVDFMRVVADGTVCELLGLHLWRDAAAVALRFEPEIGARETARLLARTARAAAADAGHRLAAREGKVRFG